MRKITVPIIIIIAATLSGCGGYWDAQGDAARTSAQARLGQAEAARQSAQAAIIDAEARGALASSQAEALTTAMRANSDLAQTAISIADNSEYTWLVAGLLLLVIACMVIAVVALARRQPAVIIQPAAMIEPPRPRAIVIETPAGAVAVEPQPGETRAAYMQRVRQIADQLNSRMISAPRR